MYKKARLFPKGEPRFLFYLRSWSDTFFVGNSVWLEAEKGCFPIFLFKANCYSFYNKKNNSLYF